MLILITVFQSLSYHKLSKLLVSCSENIAAVLVSPDIHRIVVTCTCSKSLHVASTALWELRHTLAPRPTLHTYAVQASVGLVRIHVHV